MNLNGNIKVWLLREKKWQAQTDKRQWEKRARWEMWKGQRQATQARTASSGWKGNTESSCASDQNETGALRGKAPFTAATLVLGCASKHSYWMLRQPQPHSTPSQLRFSLKTPTWSPRSAQTSSVAHQGPAAAGACWREEHSGDCWVVSKIQLNDLLKKAMFPHPLQIRKLRLNESLRPWC